MRSVCGSGSGFLSVIVRFYETLLDVSVLVDDGASVMQDKGSQMKFLVSSSEVFSSSPCSSVSERVLVSLWFYFLSQGVCRVLKLLTVTLSLCTETLQRSFSSELCVVSEARVHSSR